MQQYAFHMLSDVQEVVDKIQTAKESLKKEIEGFEEENYKSL
jgi:hypothetical protein